LAKDSNIMFKRGFGYNKNVKRTNNENPKIKEFTKLTLMGAP